MPASIRTADTNIKGLENNIKNKAGTARPHAGIGDRAYPGITDAKYQDQFTQFTYKGKGYHLSYMSEDQYHVTDESAGRVHYWFKIGRDQLEDTSEHPPGREGGDQALSELPKDVYALVQFLFTKDFATPGAITAQLEKEQRIKDAAKGWKENGYDSYDQALEMEREAESWQAAWWNGA